jgi:hypothetical protein
MDFGEHDQLPIPNPSSLAFYSGDDVTGDIPPSELAFLCKLRLRESTLGAQSTNLRPRNIESFAVRVKNHTRQ